MAKMKKINWKSKKTWKNALIIGLACITLVGAVVGLSALFRKSEETTKVVNPTYAVGGLTEKGAFLETEESIYTKDSFECLGLDIDLAFDNNISYRVFFYDTENKFLSATNKLTEDYDENTTPMFARYARIVITPNEDDKISWYEKSKYANQLEISVDKQQKWIYSENLFAIDQTMHGQYWYGLSSNATLTPVASSDGTYSSAFVDCTGYSKLIIGIVRNGNGEEYNFENVYFGTDLDNNKLATVKAICTDSDEIADIEYHTIIVPQGATRFAINYNARTINGTFVYGVK